MEFGEWYGNPNSRSVGREVPKEVDVWEKLVRLGWIMDKNVII